MADHVVFVAFAGGVRQQESVLQRYLDDSQAYPSAGNIMYNILDGAPPTDKIVYGTTNYVNGDTPIPKCFLKHFNNKEHSLRVNASVVGHYAG